MFSTFRKHPEEKEKNALFYFDFSLLAPSLQISTACVSSAFLQAYRGTVFSACFPTGSFLISNCDSSVCAGKC